MDLCSDCQKNPANVHITQIAGDETTVHHLCDVCAKKRGISISIADNALAENASRPDDDAAPSEPDRLCERCGFHLSTFREKGRLGCPACYLSFRTEVDQLLDQVHGTTRHKGKRGHRAQPATMGESLKKLRLDLKAAVDGEQFELAAELRDAITLIESDGGETTRDPD